MRPETVPLLRCPFGCEAELSLIAGVSEGGRILEGALLCPVCERCYPIEEGIARLLPGGLSAPESPVETNTVEIELKRSEMAARDEQADAYDRMRGLALFGKLEIPVTLRMLGLCPDDLLLEAGCGTGRMTTAFAARCRAVIAADFSWESLRACRRKLERAGITNVDLIQADVCALPIQSEVASKTVSCQVLEHIPTEASRAQMIAELARVTQGGGDVVLSAYQHSLYTRLFGKKEGAHAGGIYYVRFHRAELRALLACSLEVQGMTGALVYHYLARCRKPFEKANTMSDTETQNSAEPAVTPPRPRPEKKATMRWGQRELSRISLAVVLIFAAAGLIFAYRFYRNFKAQRDVVIAKNNLLTLYKALANYAQDWDGRLPPADHWTDAVAGYLSASPGTPGGKLAALHGPGDGETIGYVYNDLAAGYNLEPTGGHEWVKGNAAIAPAGKAGNGSLTSEEDRQKEIAPRDLVLLVERPGAPPNSHVAMPSQINEQGEEALFKQLAFPHFADDPNNATTVILFANGTLNVKIRRDYKSYWKE